MRFSARTSWPVNWSARFAVIAKSRVEDIEESLNSSINANRDEINGAVAAICTTWRDERNPNVRDIAEAIRQRRGESDEVKTPNRVDFYRNGKRHEATMSDLKQVLMARPDPVEAWTIICTPLMLEQCHELRRFCDQRKIAYARFHPTSTVSVAGLVEHMTTNAF